MVLVDNDESTKLLEETFILTKNIKVHQDSCRQTVALALKQNAQFSRHTGWNAIIEELGNSVREWSKLSAIESFLKCDIISAKLSALRSTLSDFQGACSKRESIASTVSEAGSLIPPLLAIFRSPDAIEHLDALPDSLCDTTIVLLQRVMSALPPEPTPLRDLVSSVLSHLQLKRKELDTGLSVSDLTAEITDISEGPTEPGQIGRKLRGTWKQNGPVVLSVIKPLTQISPKSYKALQRELRQRIGLQHQNLLPFHGTCRTDPGITLVSPYMTNGHVLSYLKSNPSANAIALLVGVADGLSYLHSCWPAIAHGDVRGVNILVSATGDAVLADHGLIKLVHRDMCDQSVGSQSPDSEADSHPLGSLINLESIRWAAPEIVCKPEELDRNVSNRPEETIIAPWSRGSANLSTGHDALLEVVTTMSDVWSFAMTIYELLIGKSPYHQHARNETVVLAISLNELPLPPSSSTQVRSEWQPELWPLMQECWRMDRRKRPSIDTVAKKLRGILGKSLVMSESLERARSPGRLPGQLSTKPSLSSITSATHSPTTSPAAPTPTPASIRQKLSRSVLSRLDTSITNPAIAPISSSSASPASSTFLHPTVPIPFRSASPSRNPAMLSPTTAKRNSDKAETNSYLNPNSARESSLKYKSAENGLVGEAEGWNQMTLTQKRSFLYHRQVQQSDAAAIHEGSDSLTRLPIIATPRSPTSIRPPTFNSDDIPIVAIDASPITPASSPTTSLPESASDSLMNSIYSPRLRTSAPQSVRSANSRTTFATAEINGARGDSFDLVDDDEDQCTLNGHTRLGDEVLTTSRTSTITDYTDIQIPPGHSTTDLMDEAFRSMASLPTVHSGGPVPHDVSSPSSESLGIPYPMFPPGLEKPQKKADKALLPEDLELCQSSLDRLLEDGRHYVKLVPESEVLVIIEEADISFLETCDTVRSAHEKILDSLQHLAPLNDIPTISKLFDAFEDATKTLPITYQEYCDGLSNLDGVLANSSEEKVYRVLLKNDDNRSQLCSLLVAPYRQLERCSSALAEMIAIFETYSSFHQIGSFRRILGEWETFVSRARLWAWQSLAGTTPLISFSKEDILPRSKSEDEQGVLRCDARFSIVMNQKNICNQMHDAQKRFEKILSSYATDAVLTELCDSQGALLRLHVETLDELYLLQRGHHPSVPPITSTFLNAIERWEAAYTQHGRLIEDMFQKKDYVNPLPFDKELQAIVRLPCDFTRNLLQSFRTLFDVTPDHHFDIELIIRLLPALEHLVDVSSHSFWHNKVAKDILDLQGTLSWGEIDKSIADLGSPVRHLLHSGTLHHPIDLSESRSSIEDRGTSVEVFVMLLDNCLIICDPQVRLGIRRLRVRAAFPLSAIHLPDLEAARVSQQQIFLLNSIEGKTVAVPFILRYRNPESAGTLQITEKNEIDALFPNEMVLLATSTMEGAAWRERLTIAKARLVKESVQKPVHRSMFKLSPIVQVSFVPTSSATYFTSGKRKLILCGGGSHGGVFVQDEKESTIVLMQSVDAKQCLVIDSLQLVLFLIGKTLCSVKMDDLAVHEPVTPTVIKNNVTFFRVGCHQGQILLVVACETSKSTILKWYSPVSRMSRRSMVFSPGIFSRSTKSFKSMGEHELPGKIHDLDILDEGIVAMGVSGFQLLIIDQGSRVKLEELPRLPVGASSAAAQRCQTSKALGVVRSGEEILLCYSDFGIYVNYKSEISGRLMDWTSPRIFKVVFGLPYFFLISENCIEVRLVENCRKLEILNGNGFRLVRGIAEARLASHTRPIGNVGDQSMLGDDGAVEEDPGLLHLAIPLPEPASGFDLMELQMEVLDLSA